MKQLGTFELVLMQHTYLDRCPMSILFFSHLGAVFYKLKKIRIDMNIFENIYDDSLDTHFMNDKYVLM